VVDNGVPVPGLLPRFSSDGTLFTTYDATQNLLELWASEDPSTVLSINPPAYVTELGFLLGGLSEGATLISGDAYFDNFTADQVPIPGAVWLFGSGLIGFAGFRRKFRKG
jgi:hypothetical protein